MPAKLHLSEPDYDKLKEALHAGGHAATTTVYREDQCGASPPTDPPTQQSKEKPKGHGRNGASSYTGAKKVAVPYPALHTGDHCPGCEKSLSHRRTANAGESCRSGAARRHGVRAGSSALQSVRRSVHGARTRRSGVEKYGETTAAMIALLKYGSGMPFIAWKSWNIPLGIPL